MFSSLYYSDGEWERKSDVTQWDLKLEEPSGAEVKEGNNWECVVNFTNPEV